MLFTVAQLLVYDGGYCFCDDHRSCAWTSHVLRSSHIITIIGIFLINTLLLLFNFAAVAAAAGLRSIMEELQRAEKIADGIVDEEPPAAEQSSSGKKATSSAGSTSSGKSTPRANSSKNVNEDSPTGARRNSSGGSSSLTAKSRK